MRDMIDGVPTEYASEKVKGNPPSNKVGFTATVDK